MKSLFCFFLITKFQRAIRIHSQEVMKTSAYKNNLTEKSSWNRLEI